MNGTAPANQTQAPACVAEFEALAALDLADENARNLSDVDLARIMTAAVKLYAARAEATDEYPAPLVEHDVTTTAVLVAVCEMVRLTNVNMFDLSMWFGRAR